MELEDVLPLLQAPGRRITWHDPYHNRKNCRGEFFVVHSGKHWVMLSVSNVRPSPLSPGFDWDDPELQQEIDDLLNKPKF